MTSVLVLDDRPADRGLLTTVLRYAGYDVIPAGEGGEALELARAERPDLIITDVLMPTMNGYEFVQQLREDPALAETPVMFCTAHDLVGDVRHMADACGVEHFITKPAYGAGAAVKHDPPLLYHLGHDPSEKHDVAARHPEALEAISREVARHLEKLVKGPDRLAARITNK